MEQKVIGLVPPPYDYQESNYQELEQKSREALRQIEIQKYERALRQEGFRDILKYGVAFYRKECMVREGNESDKFLFICV